MVRTLYLLCILFSDMPFRRNPENSNLYINGRMPELGMPLPRVCSHGAGARGRTGADDGRMFYVDVGRGSHSAPQSGVQVLNIGTEDWTK